GHNAAVVPGRDRPVPHRVGPEDGETDVDQKADEWVDQGGHGPPIGQQVCENEPLLWHDSVGPLVPRWETPRKPFLLLTRGRRLGGRLGPRRRIAGAGGHSLPAAGAGPGTARWPGSRCSPAGTPAPRRPGSR